MGANSLLLIRGAELLHSDSEERLITAKDAPVTLQHSDRIKIGPETVIFVRAPPS